MTLPVRKYHDKVKIGAMIPPTPILEQLVRGYTYFTKELTEDELKPHWLRYREFVMGLIGVNIKKIVPEFYFRGVPIPHGSRPWGWWAYDSTEPRRLLRGDPSVMEPEYGFSFGRPKCYKSLWAFNTLVFESQPDFLRRHNLLMPGEAEKIRPELIDR